MATNDRVKGSRRCADQPAAWATLRRAALTVAWSLPCNFPPVTQLGGRTMTSIRGIERRPGPRRAALRPLHRLGGSLMPAVQRRSKRVVRRSLYLARRTAELCLQCGAGWTAGRLAQRPAGGRTTVGRAEIAVRPPASRLNSCCLARLFSSVLAQTPARSGDRRSRLRATTITRARTTRFTMMR